MAERGSKLKREERDEAPAAAKDIISINGGKAVVEAEPLRMPKELRGVWCFIPEMEEGTSSGWDRRPCKRNDEMIVTSGGYQIRSNGLKCQLARISKFTAHANSFRSIRGRTLLACIFDETPMLTILRAPD